MNDLFYFLAGISFAVGAAALVTLILWIAAEGMDGGDGRTDQ